MMLARQLGRTIIFLQIEDLHFSEAWLCHMLGIVPAPRTFLHTLPSAGAWLTGSRSVTTTLAAPWGLCRPPITTMSDTFTYALPTSFVPASKRSLVLAPDVGWLQPEMAPKPTLANGIQMHREVRGDVLPGRAVIDFRPAPRLPGLRQALATTQATPPPAHIPCLLLTISETLRVPLSFPHPCLALFLEEPDTDLTGRGNVARTGAGRAAVDEAAMDEVSLVHGQALAAQRHREDKHSAAELESARLAADQARKAREAESADRELLGCERVQAEAQKEMDAAEAALEGDVDDVVATAERVAAALAAWAGSG
ncbi:hypothetical protein T484DRAFT_1803075 [Baffinella frigidus]|nr:hypothetical protein T484DRAFT_1803075 [Cryptophyta sp. CCMP2293]